MAAKPAYEESEQRVRALEKGVRKAEPDLMETLPVGISISSPEGNVLDINAAGLKLFGYETKEAFLKVPAWAHYDDEKDRERFIESHKRGLVKDFEARFVRKDGSIFWCSITSVLRTTATQATQYINVFKDISKRKQAIERVEHLNRVLRAIRNVNQLISKERDRDRLVQGACDTLIEARGYHNVWIALFDESKKLVATAEAGLGKNFVAMVERMKHGELTACGLRALSEPGVVTIRDPGSACTDCPLSPNYGDREAMTFRLEHGGRVYGLLSASIPSRLVDDEEEQAMFREVAGDIAFALHGIEQEETRKQAEKELQESEKRVKDIFMASPVGIGLVIDRRLDWANEAMYRMVGYDRDCLIGESARVLYADQDAYDRAGRELYSGIFRSGFGQVETRWVRKDGTAFDCILQACCIDPSDRSRGEIVAAVDISPLKRAQEAQLSSDERYRRLVESVADLVFIISPDGTFTYLNSEFERLTGFTAHDFIGRSFTDILAPEYIDSTVERFKRGLAGEAIPVYEVAVKHKDGKTVPVDLKVTSLLDGQGETIGRIGVARDTSERRKAALALQEKTYDLEEIVKELNCLHDISALLVERIASQDATLERLVDLIPSGWEYPEITCARILLTGKAYTTQNFAETGWRQAREIVVHGKPSGMVEVYYLESRPEDDEGPFSRQEGDLLDTIAERLSHVVERHQAKDALRESEAQLRRTQRMEAISTLAGGIAHDFNNILTAIMGYGQLAQMKLDPESEPYADLKEVLQSGNRAKLLIQQILAVGRDQEQERQPMQLKYIVKEALTFLRSTLPSTIEIQEKIDKDVGEIDADPTQMHQVLMNLCTNAGHAMEKNGGILEVSLHNVELGTGNAELNLEPGGYLRLSVSDTGCGMTREVMEKIFDPYFTTKERGEGTGIGLSVVHGIVAQHGGDITVESEPGKGSTFHVYLPLTQAEEEEPAVKEQNPLPKGAERILFIDDEAALANMGKQMLQHLGYHVTAMTSSTEALALFREDPNQFDLVITDTTMPHMPGDILAQELMKIRPDIPVIIFTGHSKRISPERAKEMGIKGFLMKPLDMRVLAETVRKALD